MQIIFPKITQNILKLSKFEPDKTEDDIKQLKISLRNVNNYDKILSITEAHAFYLLNSTFQIIHNFEKQLSDFNDESSTDQQNRTIFKSNKAYLNRYIKSFKTTYDVLSHVDKKKVINLEVLQTIINIFERIKTNQDEALEWLISEYLIYHTVIKDQDMKQALYDSSLIGKATIDMMLPHFTSISDKTLLYVKLFETYFMGFNVIESDFYKSAYIKLCLLYENCGDNIGKLENNVRTIIKDIIYENFPLEILLDDVSVNNAYIKSIYYDGIAIFASEKNTSLDGITHRFFEQITPRFTSDNTKKSSLI